MESILHCKKGNDEAAKETVVSITEGESVPKATTEESVAKPITEKSVANTTAEESLSKATTEESVAKPITEKSVANTTTEESLSKATTEDSVVATDEAKVTTEKVKKRKPGMIYLANFPRYMTIMKAKQIFGQFGKITRTYFQPLQMKGKNKNKPSPHFAEGWIEFADKRVAKEVASVMNNTLVGGKKKSKYYDYLWNIKYLHNFKWYELHEQLAYEKAVRRHKMRMEIAQAKREANIFAANVAASNKKMKLNEEQSVTIDYIQRRTESEIIESKKKSEEKQVDRSEFLKSVFSN